MSTEEDYVLLVLKLNLVLRGIIGCLVNVYGTLATLATEPEGQDKLLADLQKLGDQIREADKQLEDFYDTSQRLKYSNKPSD